MYQPYDILGFILFDEVLTQANSKLSSVAGLALDHVSVLLLLSLCCCCCCFISSQAGTTHAVGATLCRH